MINVDAALFASSGSMGAGMTDWTGDCVAACPDSFSNVLVPELAEDHGSQACSLFRPRGML
jgi:hypothetical protein